MFGDLVDECIVTLINWNLEERNRFEKMDEKIWALIMSLKCL